MHSEYVLLCNIVVATPETIFQDKVPGDGIHSLWPAVIGPIRGRTFVLLQQIIDVNEARELGVISEIVPRDRLLSRAHKIADQITKLPPLAASYTRLVLTQNCARMSMMRSLLDWPLKVFLRLIWRGWRPLVCEDLRYEAWHRAASFDHLVDSREKRVMARLF